MADLVLFSIISFDSQAAKLAVDRCMNVLDMGLKVNAWNWLVTLITQNYVAAAMDLMDHKVALGNISLAVHSQHS